MPDMFDKAQEIEQMQRDIALKKHQTTQQVSRMYCEDCDEPIPEKRRQLIVGATRCIECQQRYELQKRNVKR